MFSEITTNLDTKRIHNNKTGNGVTKNRKYHPFHFMLKSELFAKIKKLKQDSAMPLAKIIKKTAVFLTAVSKYYGHRKKVFISNPETPVSKDDIMTEEIWVNISEKLYRVMKFTHSNANSFSIAHIFRSYLEVLIDLVDKYGFAFVISQQKDFYSCVMKLIQKIDKPEYYNTHMMSGINKKQMSFIIFDEFYYPVYSFFP